MTHFITEVMPEPTQHDGTMGKKAVAQYHRLNVHVQLHLVIHTLCIW